MPAHRARKPRRRTTRRIAAESTAPVEEVVSQPSEEMTATTPEAQPEADLETQAIENQASDAPEDDTDKPAKKGWWNRGGGLF